MSQTATGSLTQNPKGDLRVALINMPWARTDAPSIQCGLLQSIARQAGFDCDVKYVNLELAARLGPDMYNLLSSGQDRLNLIGEWVFAFAAFGAVTPEESYLADYPEVKEMWSAATGRPLGELIDLRSRVLPEWLDELADEPTWSGYDVIGFSSTFWQNTSSLALGRRLKDRYPRTHLVYGGANFDGEMGREFARSVAWIDYVVIGEGDVAWPELLTAISSGEPQTRIPGVLTRSAGRFNTPESLRLEKLDGLPVPDYRDYFHTLDSLGRSTVTRKKRITIPVEFSRGCWWGEKHHCTFCGLNGMGMAYRAKLPERAISELVSLVTDYSIRDIEAVDNILDMGYISTVCTELTERRWDINFFFEVKANLTRKQLGLLHRAGVRRIQPGIESLSSSILQLMRKGSSKLINIRILKWARYYGIGVSWNLLAGFPCESDHDYQEQARLFPLLHHLQPPNGVARIWLERFSPFFTDPSLGLANIRPLACYRHIYPAAIDCSNIAYFFDYDARDVVTEESLSEVRSAVTNWQASWQGTFLPTLSYRRLPGQVTVTDRRGKRAHRQTLAGWQADIYEACGDSPRSAARVREQLAGSGTGTNQNEVEAALDQFCRDGIMVCEDGKYLSLALPENLGW